MLLRLKHSGTEIIRASVNFSSGYRVMLLMARATRMMIGPWMI